MATIILLALLLFAILAFAEEIVKLMRHLERGSLARQIRQARRTRKQALLLISSGTIRRME